MRIGKIILALGTVFLFGGQAQAQMVLSSPWHFGTQKVQNLSVPFLSWHGEDENMKASLQIYRVPSSVVKKGDGMVIALAQGVFQCDGTPLVVAMSDGKLFEFPTDSACAGGVMEIHAAQDQAQPLWEEIQKGALPTGIRQNSHYLVLQSTDINGLSAFQKENDFSPPAQNENQEIIFSSEWQFRTTKVKSGLFPTLAYEALSEDSRIVVQIFKMPTSLSAASGNIMIVMVPEKEPFKCAGNDLHVKMSDGSFFDLPVTGQCVQGMVQAHSTEAQEAEISKKIQSGILPMGIGIGEKAYFKLLTRGGNQVEQFQQANIATG